MPEKYLCNDRGRWYFRRRGCPWTRIREPYGTPEFWRCYAELLAKADAGELKAPTKDAPKPGTWRWLCVKFFGSETGLLAMDPNSQRVRRLELEATWAEPIEPDSPHKFGDCPLAHFTGDSVRIMRARKAATPEAANVRIKAISRVFKWALEELTAYDRKRYGVVSNPARDVARLKSNNPDGHHTWTVEEIEQYEEGHPIGTKAYLAMQLMLLLRRPARRRGGARAPALPRWQAALHPGQEQPAQAHGGGHRHAGRAAADA